MEIDWSTYRKQVGDLTWRAATFEDVPAILYLWKAHDRMLGTEPKPMLFARPVLLTMVAQDPSGRIVDAFYVEATVDITKIGISKKGFDAMLPLQDDLRAWLRGRGFHTAHASVRLKIRDRMAAMLEAMGFRSQDGIMSHWIRRL